MSRTGSNVSISGFVTVDAKLVENTKDKKILELSIGQNHDYQDKDGNWVEVPEFVKLKAFGKQAEYLVDKVKLKKGDEVTIMGATLRVKQNKVEDKTYTDTYIEFGQQATVASHKKK